MDSQAIRGMAVAGYGPFVIAVLGGLFGTLLSVVLGISALLILVNVAQFIMLIVLGARIIKYTSYGLAHAAGAGALAGIVIGLTNPIAYWLIFVPLRGSTYSPFGFILLAALDVVLNLALWLFLGAVAGLVGGLAGRRGMEQARQAEEKEAKRREEAEKKAAGGAEKMGSPGAG